MIKEYLKNNGISFKSFKHPAVYTCEEAEKYNKEIKGIHSKNLFIKDRKSQRFYLTILPADKKLAINELGEIIGDKLKFANENDLKEKLKLESGAVSPFGLINDVGKIGLLIDREVWDSNYVSFHPNINTETLELPKKDFHKFVESLSNKLTII